MLLLIVLWAVLSLLVHAQLPTILPPDPANGLLYNPYINFNAPVSYSFSLDLWVGETNTAWRTVFSRGKDNNDRTPTLEIAPNSNQICFSHKSTRNWNEQCCLARLPIMQTWNYLQVIVEPSSVKMTMNNTFTTVCGILPATFTWGTSTRNIMRNAQNNDRGAIGVKNLAWTYDSFYIPAINFDAPPSYSLSTQITVSTSVTYRRNVFVRGTDPARGTPALDITSNNILQLSHVGWPKTCNLTIPSNIGRSTFTLDIIVQPSWMKMTINKATNVTCVIPSPYVLNWSNKATAFHTSYFQTALPDSLRMNSRAWAWKNEPVDALSGMLVDFTVPDINYEITFNLNIPSLSNTVRTLFTRGSVAMAEKTPTVYMDAFSTRLSVIHQTVDDPSPVCTSVTVFNLNTVYAIRLTVFETITSIYVNDVLDIQCTTLTDAVWGHHTPYSQQFIISPAGAPLFTQFTFRQIPVYKPPTTPVFTPAINYATPRFVFRMWIFVKQYTPYLRTLVLRGRDVTDMTPRLMINTNNGQILFNHMSTRNNNEGFASGFQVDRGVWTQIHLLVQHSNASLLINGRLDSRIELSLSAANFVWGVNAPSPFVLDPYNDNQQTILYAFPKATQFPNASVICTNGGVYNGLTDICNCAVRNMTTLPDKRTCECNMSTTQFGPTCRNCTCAFPAICDSGFDGTGQCMCFFPFVLSNDKRTCGCSKGYYGKECKQCQMCPQGSKCNDGVTGNGQCTPLPRYKITVGSGLIDCLYNTSYGLDCLSTCPATCYLGTKCSSGINGTGFCVTIPGFTNMSTYSSSSSSSSIPSSISSIGDSSSTGPSFILPSSSTADMSSASSSSSQNVSSSTAAVSPEPVTPAPPQAQPPMYFNISTSCPHYNTTTSTTTNVDCSCKWSNTEYTLIGIMVFVVLLCALIFMFKVCYTSNVTHMRVDTVSAE